MLKMNRSFKLEWAAANLGERASKLSVRTSTGSFREIKRKIVLSDDDFTDIERFDLGHFNCQQNLSAHIIDKLLPKPKRVESLVAWYSAIELASVLLATSTLMVEKMLPGEDAGCGELHEDEVRSVFRTASDCERCLALGRIGSFLAGKR